MLKLAFDLGRSLAFGEEGSSKLATSRWREAVRSGELSHSQGQALMSRLGIDPERFLTGLEQGNQRLIERLGSKLIEGEHPVIDFGISPLLMNPDTRAIHYDPQIDPKAKAVFVRHELDELRRMDRALPELSQLEAFLRSKKSYVPASNPEGMGHAGADVILKELRNLRMLPEVPGMLREMRPETEWREISNLFGTTIEKFQIPKADILSLAKKIQESAWAKRFGKLI